MDAIRRYLGLGPHRCADCHIPARDTVVGGDDRHVYHCRDHVIALLERAFADASFPIVLCDPDFGRCDSMYPYYPLDRFDEYGLTPGDRAAVADWLAAVDGEVCVDCNEPAFALHVPKSGQRFDVDGPRLPEFDLSPARFLCTDDAMRALQPVIYNHSRAFTNGVYLPEGGPGIFVTTFL
jgi:hypothetical protein